MFLYFRPQAVGPTIEFTAQWVMVLMNNSLALDMDYILYELLANNGLNM